MASERPSTAEGAAPASLQLPTPWLTVDDAAAYLKVGPKCIYREVRAGRLRAAKVGGRRQLRFRAEWLDEFLEGQASGGGEAWPRRVAS